MGRKVCPLKQQEYRLSGCRAVSTGVPAPASCQAPSHQQELDHTGRSSRGQGRRVTKKALVESKTATALVKSNQANAVATALSQPGKDADVC